MQQILTQRRESKLAIHFRDDLSEYSSPSSWGEGSGPLSLGDHRLAAEGLQARRTVGEALLRAQWERQCEANAEACRGACKCLGNRATRFCLSGLRLGFCGLRPESLRRTPSRPVVVFTWAEVQSLVMLPYEEKGPYLMAVTTFRLREDGSREWLLQAGSLRARARWAVEMNAAILRDRNGAGEGRSGHPCKCCGSGRGARLSTALFMDMVRISCEAARLQPSVEVMERLVEVLDLMTETREGVPGGGVMELSTQGSGPPHFPLAALRRFGDTVRRAREIFVEWQRWREVALLLRPPQGWDVELWHDRVLPFLQPADPSLQDPLVVGYPLAVSSQLEGAAERCRRMLS